MSDPTTMRRTKITLTRDDLERDNREDSGVSEDVSVEGMVTMCSGNLATLPCRTDMWTRC